MDDITSKNDLSPNDIKNIVNFSFESYLQGSIDAFKDIKSKDLDIIASSESVEDEINMIKSQYQQMSKESAEANDLKTSFSAKIKNFFIKVWALICDIFYKFAEIVVNLIKSLIIFIQKKRLQAKSIISMMKDKGLKGLTADGLDIYEIIQKNGYKIKTCFMNDKNNFMTFKDVHETLNNPDLKQFVKSTIILKNKDSIFNINSLKEYFQKDLIGVDNPDEVKLTNLENAVNWLYAQAVFYGEVSPNHKKETSFIDNYKNLLEARNISKVAHKMVYGNDEVKFVEVDLNDFFDITSDEKLIKFKTSWIQYCQDTKLVLDQGGYIDTLEEVLKRYKDIAKNDAQNIKEISNYVKAQLEGMDPNADPKVQGKVKRFTNLMINVKNIKNHCIRLRQSVILDVITLYSMENRAWYLATGKADITNLSKDESDTTNVAGDTIKDSVIDMNKGQINYNETDE